MTYSVVITTYNGASFIREQLESIRMQTLSPYEVLIFDDGSQDNTVSLINDYIRLHDLTWRLVINETKLDWMGNYMQGLGKATGDFLFLCDQDDIWMPERCEKMLSVMESQRSCDVLMTNFKLLYTGTCKSVYKQLHAEGNSGRIRKIPCNKINLLSVMRPGCSYCVRRSFFQTVQDCWYEDVSHDRLLYTLSLLRDSLFLFEYQSLQFRQHRYNNTPVLLRTRESRTDHVCYLLTFFQSVRQWMETHSFGHTPEGSCSLQVLEEFCSARKAFFDAPSLLAWVVLVMKYHASYPTMKKMVGDLWVGVFT